MNKRNGLNTMGKSQLSPGFCAKALFACLLGAAAAGAHASPGELSQSPLFLAKLVQPNIFFLLDDSGSMDWEVLYRNGGGGSGSVDFSPDSDSERLLLCKGYNVLAYDPLVPYTPWHGKDTSGNVLGDSNPTAARTNPYTGGGSTTCDNNGTVYNSNGTTCNLVSGFGGSGAVYYNWTDSNGNGLYDAGECDLANPQFVSGLTADQRINYANWFSYYRKREYVMKRAVSEIVDESAERVGFGTINRNNHITKTTEVGTQVKDVDDITVPINPVAAANKATLLDNLLGVNSSSSTPLRLGLQHVGQYFADQMNNSSLFGYTPSSDADSAGSTTPILNANLGGTCQQNFAIVMSDGYWNGGDPSVGNTDTDGAGDFDGMSYDDNVSNTLADVAMQYYETDLSGIANEVPISKIQHGPSDTTECNAVTAADAHLHPNCYDTNTTQHLVTYTVAFGVVGTIPWEDTSGARCLPSRGTDLVTQDWPETCYPAPHPTTRRQGWPTPAANSSTAVDDMLHAAWNGRGKFLSAKDPQGLIDALQEAIDDISSKNPPAAAAVAVDTFNIVSGGNVVQGKFDSDSWSGELYSYAISGKVVSTTPTWSAHDLLDARGYNTRTVVTYNGTQGMIFEFPSDYSSTTNFGVSELSQAQVDDLMVGAPYSLTTTDATEKAANQTYGEQMVAYHWGDHSNEIDVSASGTLRNRKNHKLGDIIQSAPIFVGDPDPSTYTDASYQAWANNTIPTGAKGRQKMIYVGANDGAMHAFNATTGEEVFAFFPQAVFNDTLRWGLHWLANKDYEHRYYVDGEFTVAEIFGDLHSTGTDKWNTILIGTLRGGGRSVFAIDISDPTDFSTPAGVTDNILWEFTNDELGYTYSKPTIAKLNNGRWAAIFGNGYNPGSASTGEASLFIKYLDSPTDFVRISTNTGSNATGDCLDPTNACNGLSTPAVVDLGADKVADRVYAGDILGNLWVFDISSNNPGLWTLAYGSAPLFTARNSTNAAEPITSQPIVILHPTERHSNTSPNTMVYFGTGQYIAEHDPVSNSENTFYGIWDNGTAITAVRDSVLVEQTVNQTVLGSKDVRLLSNNPVDYSVRRGWYFDLPESGERVISNPIVFGDLVVYNSITPSSNLCSSSGGTSWLMVHNLLDGSEPDFIAIDVNNDGLFDSSDQVGDTNVGGVRSGNLNWQITFAKSGPGAEAVAFVPSADLDTYNMRGGRSVGTRSSWGRYRME